MCAGPPGAEAPEGPPAAALGKGGAENPLPEARDGAAVGGYGANGESSQGNGGSGRSGVSS